MNRTREHELIDVLVIGLCCVICGGKLEFPYVDSYEVYEARARLRVARRGGESE